jgi:AcrR family transcriptional regulator
MMKLAMETTTASELDQQPTDPLPLSGRRAQAARNDERILEAARAVFVQDPGAPISAVAERAGVGISALYRRYPSKQALLAQLCGEGLQRYIAAVEAGLANEDDPWAGFAEFMRRAVDTESSSLTVSLAGTFTPTEELFREAARAQELNVRLLERTKAAGVIRPDIEVNDIAVLLEQLAAIKVGDDERRRGLRHRYLALMLDALRAHAAEPLPGSPPSWEEISGRWSTGDGTAS